MIIARAFDPTIDIIGIAFFVFAWWVSGAIMRRNDQ